MRLHAVGGLCNRLRAILSYLAAHDTLTVVWEPDEYVSHGRFSDVFGPLDGVTFVDSGPWDVEDFAPCKAAPADWEDAYAELRPFNERSRTPPRVSYVAIHVRRTDHVPDVGTHGGKMTRLEEFLGWTRQWPELPVWCATDNAETRAKLVAVLGDRFRGGVDPGGREEQALTDHRRNGRLEDAVVDLYACVCATHFKGSYASSFTDTIEILRRLRT